MTKGAFYPNVIRVKVIFQMSAFHMVLILGGKSEHVAHRWRNSENNFQFWHCCLYNQINQINPPIYRHTGAFWSEQPSNICTSPSLTKFEISTVGNSFMHQHLAAWLSFHTLMHLMHQHLAVRLSLRLLFMALILCV